MDYLTKLDQIRQEESETATLLDVETAEKLLAQELHDELSLSYDLQESDIVRAIKIQSLLKEYEVFDSHKALAIFYAIAKSGALQTNSLSFVLDSSVKKVTKILKQFEASKLITLTQYNDWTLSEQGKTLAQNIGIDFFI